MKYTMDLIGIGECLVEFNEVGPGAFEIEHSGDVLNTLSYASALGLRTGLISAFGDDMFTEGLLTCLKQSSIDTSCAPVLPARSNGVYFVRRDENRKPQFHFLRANSAATSALEPQSLDALRTYASNASALILSSIPFATMKDASELPGIIAPAGIKLFDTNARPALWPEPAALRDLVSGLSAHCDILLLTDDDDRFISGHVRPPEEVLETYRAQGWKQIILRRGERPTMTSWNGAVHEIPVARGLQVVDTTGAGDAFNAGFVSSWMETEDISRSIARANAVAGHSTEFIGGRAKEPSLERIRVLESDIRGRMETGA